MSLAIHIISGYNKKYNKNTFLFHILENPEKSQKIEILFTHSAQSDETTTTTTPQQTPE